MTGVEMIPSGWMLPHFDPLDWFALGGLPMLVIQTVWPSLSSSAITSLPVVATMKTPLPSGPFWTKSGEAHMLPENGNAASIGAFVAAVTDAFVSAGCVNNPSRERCLFRCRTESADWDAPPLPETMPPEPLPPEPRPPEPLPPE